MPLVVVDAGHGGGNAGAVYQGRKEKDDALALALAIGRLLEENDVAVYYTRTRDVYESPVQKAMEGNAVNADYFVSVHRNFSTYPDQYSGVEALVFSRYGEAARLAGNILRRLEAVGFEDLGIEERGELAVLRRTRMPAVLLEVGFLNTEADNERLDQQFYQVAQAVADGILETIQTA